MDDGRKFLEEQIDAAAKKYEDLASSLLKIRAEMELAQNDLNVFKTALEAYTRNSSSPYRPTETILSEATPFVEEINTEIDENTANNNGNGNSHTAPATRKVDYLSKSTKAGVIRGILFDSKIELTVEDILAKIPEGLSFTISKTDLYKMLPRMVNKGEVVRIGTGLYRIADAKTNGQRDTQPALLTISENTQSNGKFILLEAVREVIRTFKGGRFLANDIFAILLQKYPNNFNEQKRGSLSATLSNLITGGELVKVGTEENRAIYQATENGGLT